MHMWTLWYSFRKFSAVTKVQFLTPLRVNSLFSASCLLAFYISRTSQTPGYFKKLVKNRIMAVVWANDEDKVMCSSCQSAWLKLCSCPWFQPPAGPGEAAVRVHIVGCNCAHGRPGGVPAYSFGWQTLAGIWGVNPQLKVLSASGSQTLR